MKAALVGRGRYVSLKVSGARNDLSKGLHLLPLSILDLPRLSLGKLHFSMSIVIEKILAASPNTARGQPTQLSADSKGERIAYAVGDVSLKKDKHLIYS